MPKPAEAQKAPVVLDPMAPPPAAGGTSPLSESPAKSRKMIVVDDKLVTLAFKDESVASIIPFIQEWTGKAVMVRLTQIKSINITLVNDKPLPKSQALDLVFQAFRLNGLGVVENNGVIMIDMLTELPKLGPWIVLGPDADVMALNEEGNFVVKYFRLKHAKANDVHDRLQDTMPDYAVLGVDTNSNQIILSGDVGLAKKTQLMIYLLDVPPYVDVKTEVFAIKYQDANVVADSIRELFEGVGTQNGGNRSTRQPAANQRNRQAQPGGQPQAGIPQVGVSEQLVVTVLPALNQITVRAEPTVLDEIRRLISTAWDLPPNQNGSPFRTYLLRYSDPLKVQATLQALLEGGGGGSAGGARRGQAGGRSPIQQGGGGGSGAEAAVANVFRIEAFPDSSRLVVISRTPENFIWLDEMVKALDQPLDVGLPKNIQLKYASAFRVAEIINVLFAEDGSGSGISRPDDKLTGIDFANAGGGGPSSSSSTGGDTGGSSRSGASGASSGGNEFSFPWQNGRGGAAGEQSPVSPAIGKSRVVPSATQNSLIVLAPPQIQDAIIAMIEELDRPGRQVMITAVLAEVQLGDGFSFGLRTGSNLTTLNGTDNSIAGQVDLDLKKGNGDGGTGDNFASPWFDISTLNVSTSVGFLLQALKSTNDVRILQEPRVFTSDNEEAKFFSGQDITFQTGQTTGGTTGGGTTSSFEQQAVGIGLNVRPRITRDQNVAMDIEILLSNVDFSVGTFNNNPVVNRRQTNTKVTVKNGQTIVISGIRKEEETSIKRAIPILGEIPILDIAFSSTEKKKTVSELVVFVTPIVVENPDENDSNYNASERQRLDNLRRPLDLRKAMPSSSGFFENLRSVEGPDGQVIELPTEPQQPQQPKQVAPASVPPSTK